MFSKFVGKAPTFESEQAAIAALWSVSKGFGPHTPDNWAELCRPQLRRIDDSDPTNPGAWRLHYDPAIRGAWQGVTEEQFKQAESIMWYLYVELKSSRHIHMF